MNHLDGPGAPSVTQPGQSTRHCVTGQCMSAVCSLPFAAGNSTPANKKDSGNDFQLAPLVHTCFASVCVCGSPSYRFRRVINITRSALRKGEYVFNLENAQFTHGYYMNMYPSGYSSSILLCARSSEA